LIKWNESKDRAMEVTPHLTFSGQCEAAFEFYARALGGTIVTMLPFGNSPLAEQVPSEWHGKILHASLAVGGTTLLGADVLPDDYERPRGFFVTLSLDDPVDAQRKFQATSRRRNGADADPEDVLVTCFRCASRSIRRTVGDQLRAKASVTCGCSLQACSEVSWSI
jgi:PhnB protein